MFRRGHAVVIGINDYQHVNGLRYAVNDAEQVYRYLIDTLGYRARNVKLLIDYGANKSSIMRSLEWLAKASQTFDASPTAALIFYSGQGFCSSVSANSKENEGYLCPCETNLDDLSATAISTTELSTAFTSIKCNLAVVVDACHAESFTTIRDANHSVSPALKAGFDSGCLSRLRAGKDWAILSALCKEQQAREDSKINHGILTYHLLQALDKYDRQEETIRVLKLFSAVVDKLNRYGKKQTVTMDGHAEDFVIGLNHPEKVDMTGHLEFANRVKELGMVTQVKGGDCFIVDAPAGYGKTRFLSEVQSYYDSGKYKESTEDNWKCILIKLDECPYHSALRYQQYIANKILYAFGNQSSDNGELAANLASNLEKLIVNQNTKVLLLFDGVENHREAAEWFLGNVLPDLKRRVNESCIRAVFSGRYTQPWFNNNYQATPMALTGFSHDVVRYVISDAQKIHQRFETLSQEIAFLTGGHPRAIEALVKLLRERGWAVDLTRGYLSYKDRVYLFDGCQDEIGNIIDEILEDTKADIRGLLMLLCVFRHCDSSILRKVGELARVSANQKIIELSALLPKSIIDLMPDLIRAGLISTSKPGYTDGPIRNLLLIKTCYQDNEFYNSLHLLAYRTFDALVKEKSYENEVFVSYAWGGESEDMVDKLERVFTERGIRVVRDKKELGYKSSIKAFAQRIGRGQCIVLVISDKYLRSEHCMYELVEVDKNQNLRDRIFPIVLADAHIYKPTDRLNYIKYWDGQIEQLKQAITQVDATTNLVGIAADQEKYESIRASFDHLIDLLRDMNALTPEMHTANRFSDVIVASEFMLAEKKTDLPRLASSAATLGESYKSRSEQQQYLLQKFYHYLFSRVQTETGQEAISKLTKTIRRELVSCIHDIKVIADPLLFMEFAKSLESDYETRTRLRELVGENNEKDILSVLD